MKNIPGWRYVAGLVLASVAALLLAGCDAPAETVRLPSARIGYDIEDDVISRNVTAALKAESEFPLHVVKVSTSRGEVVLSGELATHAQIDRSLSIALLVSGVQRVENRLRAPNPDAAPERASRRTPGPSAIPAVRF